MPRTRDNYSGSCRGCVTPGTYQAEVILTREEALDLIRHLAGALQFNRGAKVEVHWGRRGGEERKHLIKVSTPAAS